MHEIIREKRLYGNNLIPEFAVGEPIIHYTISGDSNYYVAVILSDDAVDEKIYPKEMVIRKDINGNYADCNNNKPFFFDSIINWIEHSLKKQGIVWYPS